MQTASDILSNHIDKISMDEVSVNIWPDMISALHEYASGKVKEALKVSAERARIEIDRDFPKPHKLQIVRYSDGDGTLFSIDKQSILSLETEIVNNIIKEG